MGPGYQIAALRNQPEILRSNFVPGTRAATIVNSRSLYVGALVASIAKLGRAGLMRLRDVRLRRLGSSQVGACCCEA